MMKKTLFSLLALCVFALCSCSESEEVSEFDNWKERNEHFIDSIASLANSNTDGWSKIKAYTMGDSLGMNADKNYYIYVKTLEYGAGTYNPQARDSVRVHYSGRLIPTDMYPQGYNFDKSYNTSVLNEATDVPTLMGVSGTVTGFATALMHMAQGDRWLVVVPQYLGYKDEDFSSVNIPAYSTLIFDIKLARIYRFGLDTNTKWY